jgi:hypothetical protein
MKTPQIVKTEGALRGGVAGSYENVAKCSFMEGQFEKSRAGLFQ